MPLGVHCQGPALPLPRVGVAGRGFHAASQTANSTYEQTAAHHRQRAAYPITGCEQARPTTGSEQHAPAWASQPIPRLMLQVELFIARPEQLGGLQPGSQAALTVRRAAGQQHLPPHAVRALVVTGGRAVADVLLRGVPEDGCIR